MKKFYNKIHVLTLECDDHAHLSISVITKLPNFEQSYKWKVKTHKYINRQNQSNCTELFGHIVFSKDCGV
jgi:hypothetical protein